jgi:hypothetical protein
MRPSPQAGTIGGDMAGTLLSLVGGMPQGLLRRVPRVVRTGATPRGGSGLAVPGELLASEVPKEVPAGCPCRKPHLPRVWRSVCRSSCRTFSTLGSSDSLSHCAGFRVGSCAAAHRRLMPSVPHDTFRAPTSGRKSPYCVIPLALEHPETHSETLPIAPVQPKRRRNPRRYWNYARIRILAGILRVGCGDSDSRIANNSVTRR